jgi:putative ABC transport system ATP-binding protein
MNADITSGWAGAGGAPTPPADPLIQLSGVTKRYDDGQPALRDVSLDIAPGEAVAVMGPSGSGKSTLLNLIAGLDRPSSGTVTVAGQRIDRLSETRLARFRRQQIGMIFQFFNLLDDLTVADNVLLPAQLAGLSRRQARARATELLAALRIEQHKNTYPGRLSGGERQRVAIARALVNRPALLLADEPTGALDTATGEEIGELLRDLHTAGHTLVLVTHNPDLAGHYTSRTVHIADGFIFRNDNQPGAGQPAAPAGVRRWEPGRSAGRYAAGWPAAGCRPSSSPWCCWYPPGQPCWPWRSWWTPAPRSTTPSRRSAAPTWLRSSTRPGPRRPSWPRPPGCRR